MTDQRWLLDTSILVDVLRGHAPAKAWLDGLARTQRCISVVTAAELLGGCRNQQEQRTLERELALYSLLHIDPPISHLGLDLYRSHRLRHGMGFLDCLIAATALTHGVRLATINLRHFQPFTELTAERPY